MDAGIVATGTAAGSDSKALLLCVACVLVAMGALYPLYNDQAPVNRFGVNVNEQRKEVPGVLTGKKSGVLPATDFVAVPQQQQDLSSGKAAKDGSKYRAPAAGGGFMPHSKTQRLPDRNRLL